MGYEFHASAAMARGGKQESGVWRLKCPVHGGTRSLAVQTMDGKVVWKCHAGCDQIQVRDAMIRDGLLTRSTARGTAPDRHRDRSEQEFQKKLRWCRSTWESATTDYRVINDWYRTRGFSDPGLCDAAFRSAAADDPAVKWHAGRSEMLARIVDWRGRMIGLHKTRIVTGSGKFAVNRRSFGSTGGGAIRLFADSSPSGHLAIAEGIETAIAWRIIHGIAPVWSVISANGISGFVPPDWVQLITVAADFDGAGLTAFENLRRRLQGRIQVNLSLPGGVSHYKRDWNDELEIWGCIG